MPAKEAPTCKRNFEGPLTFCRMGEIVISKTDSGAFLNGIEV